MSTNIQALSKEQRRYNHEYNHRVVEIDQVKILASTQAATDWHYKYIRLTNYGYCRTI